MSILVRKSGVKQKAELENIYSISNSKMLLGCLESRKKKALAKRKSLSQNFCFFIYRSMNLTKLSTFTNTNFLYRVPLIYNYLVPNETMRNAKKTGLNLA